MKFTIEAECTKDILSNILNEYRKDAYDYYSYCKICPDGTEVLGFICDRLEKTFGININEYEYKAIAKKLNIVL